MVISSRISFYHGVQGKRIVMSLKKYPGFLYILLLRLLKVIYDLCNLSDQIL